MKKILLTLIIFLTYSYAFAADQYTLEADKVIKQDNDTYLAEGNVVVKYLDMVITADNITFVQSLGRVIAKGNVHLISPTQELKAEEIDYFMEDEIGTAVEIKGFLAPFHYLCASKMERTGATTFKVENAKISTCSGDIPDWSLSMYSGTLELEGYMQANHVTAQIKDTPFFYFPKLFYPLTSKRETGLLMPNGGVTKTKGTFLSAAYFIAPDVNYDFTVAVNLFTKAGVQPMAEARYANSLENNFYGSFEWINDTSSKADTKNRYKYILKNSYSPIDSITLSVNANNVSDYLYTRDFYRYSISPHYRQNKDNMFFDEAVANYINEYLDVRVSYRNTYMFRDLAQGYQVNRIEQMPSFAIEKIIPIHEFFILDYKATYDYLYYSNLEKGLDGITLTNTSTKYHRVGLDAKAYVPVDFGVAVLIPTISFGYTYWNNATDIFNVKNFDSEVFGAVKQISDTDIYRYNGGLSLILSFRELYQDFGPFTHAIVNTVTGNYTPLLDQTNIPRLFTNDFIAPAGGLTYKMINYLTGKNWSTTLTFTQSVDVLAKDLFSPLVLNMATNVLGIVVNTLDMTLKHSGTLTETESRFQYISDDLTINITKYFYLNGSYAHDTRVADAFNTAIRAGAGVRAFGVSLYAYNKWQGYNTDGFSNLFTVGQGASAMYTAECWSLGAMVERNSYFTNYITGKVSRDEVVVTIAFSLRGLGDMKFQFTNTIDRLATP